MTDAIPSAASLVSAILLISCTDQRGLVAAVTDFIFTNGGNILHLDQHVDAEAGVFFMRVEWDMTGFVILRHELHAAFDFVARRFQMTWEKKLNDDLSAFGMGVAFSDLQANFSRMSSKPLFISTVVQKTFVDVNEEGTEAAAATSVGVQPTSAPPTIRVDRPFIFAIRERFSGTILFMGKIADL